MLSFSIKIIFKATFFQLSDFASFLRLLRKTQKNCVFFASFSVFFASVFASDLDVWSGTGTLGRAPPSPAP